MVNHIHVHRANGQPLFDYPVLAGPVPTPSPSPSPNANTGTGAGTGAGTPSGPSNTANTGSGTPATPTGNTSAASNSPTPATGTTSASTDGGLLGGLLPTLGSSASTTSTASSTSPATTPTFGAAAQPTFVPAAQSGSASVVSTVVQTLDPSGSSSPAPPPSTSNPDAGPIAGGVIGGLFAVAALGMFISFLLRRRRRKQIDKEILGTDIFGGSGYRSSTILIDDEAKADRADPDKFIPRPPSMIERRVGGGANDSPNFGGAPYGAPAAYSSAGYNDPNVYGAPAPPAYPPQPMQRGYYQQGQQQPPYSSHNAHFQQPGYNQAYAYSQPHGGPQIPSRPHTPQVPGNNHHAQYMVVQPPGPPPAHGLPNPFGARSDANRSDGGHGGTVVPRERRHSGQSDYAHRPSEELPAYGFGFDETKYADLHRDSKPRPDSIDVHGAM